MINQQNFISSDIEIFVVDGQNQTQIESYIKLSNTNNWDPCIPITFNRRSTITITFNSDIINDSRDWYPSQLCNNNSSGSKYLNEYLFDGGRSLIINNLIIRNYVSASTNYRNYSFIRSIGYHDASITCNNCSFINISSIHKYFFNSMASIYLFNNLFSYIKTSQPIIYGQNKYNSSTRAFRQFTIENTNFSHINASSIFKAEPSFNDVSLGTIEISVTW